MALVTCPDCQRPISAAAPTCPHCGRPSKQAARNQKTIGVGLSLFRIILLLVFCVLVLYLIAAIIQANR